MDKQRCCSDEYDELQAKREGDELRDALEAGLILTKHFIWWPPAVCVWVYMDYCGYCACCCALHSADDRLMLKLPQRSQLLYSPAHCWWLCGVGGWSGGSRQGS